MFSCSQRAVKSLASAKYDDMKLTLVFNRNSSFTEQPEISANTFCQIMREDMFADHPTWTIQVYLPKFGQNVFAAECNIVQQEPGSYVPIENKHKRK